MFAQKPPSDDDIEAEQETAKMLVFQNAAGTKASLPTILSLQTVYEQTVFFAAFGVVCGIVRVLPLVLDFINSKF